MIAAVTLQTNANRVHLEHHHVQVQLHVRNACLACSMITVFLSLSPCQLGFFSDGVEPKMCQQRALGSCRRLTSLRASRDCPDFQELRSAGFTPHKIRAERTSNPCAC